MMNEDYRIFGKIISALNKDYPPKVSKNFTNRIMSEINRTKMNFSKQTSNNYLNVVHCCICPNHLIRSDKL